METRVLRTGVFEKNEGVKRKRSNEEMRELMESYPEKAKGDLGTSKSISLKEKTAWQGV